MCAKYAIGIDFGTESGRALLVDVADGREIATAVYPYANGVIDERLPGTDIRLEPDWALQDPNDYIGDREAHGARRPAAKRHRPGGRDRHRHRLHRLHHAARQGGRHAAGAGARNCATTRTAWVKLWKHHAAQPEADRINEVARERGEPWLDFYGGKISSEWFFSKALQILNEAPEIYAAADRMLEATDWVIWQLTGHETRNSCTAGYKAI